MPTKMALMMRHPWPGTYDSQKPWSSPCPSTIQVAQRVAQVASRSGTLIRDSGPTRRSQDGAAGPNVCCRAASAVVVLVCPWDGAGAAGVGAGRGVDVEAGCGVGLDVGWDGGAGIHSAPVQSHLPSGLSTVGLAGVGAGASVVVMRPMPHWEQRTSLSAIGWPNPQVLDNTSPKQRRGFAPFVLRLPRVGT